jgi:hypothetical protein
MTRSAPTLKRIDPLLAESRREGTRVRVFVRDKSVGERIIEAIVIEVLEGRDGRARLRLAIPTGSGDPVEIRVLLESVSSVERIEAPVSATNSEPRLARATLGFGEDFSKAR